MELEKAILNVIRTQLIKKEKVSISGLGTFKNVHRSQYQKHHGGQAVLVPPCDYVVFTQEKK